MRNIWTLGRLAVLIFILSNGNGGSGKFVFLILLALVLYFKEIGLFAFPHIALMHQHAAPAPADGEPLPELLPNGRPKPDGLFQELIALVVPFVLSIYPNWHLGPVFHLE